MVEPLQSGNSSPQGITLDISLIIQFFKKNYVILFLLACMIFGFYLRSYHMDFPVIGYHNMKENQYIPYTEFMYNANEFLDYFRTETYWIGAQEHGYFTQYEFPLIPWIILSLWGVFGIKLWAARFVIILFSVASIPLLYLVGKKLTDNTLLILIACLFFTIMPINIFFGRNVQPEAPGLFFILLATYFFFCWRESIILGQKGYNNFLLFSSSILLAILLKIPNGIGLVPLLFFVPYKNLYQNKKSFVYFIILFVFIISLFPLWVKFSQWTMPGAATVGTSGFSESFQEVQYNIHLTLSMSFWNEYYPAFHAFVIDNFTLWFFWLALFGVIFGFLKYNTNLGLFLIGSFFSIFIYILCFADKVRAHAYYQVVFLPLICFACAYALYILASILNQQLGNKYEKYLFITLTVIWLFITFPSLQDSNNRVFDTIYYGEDIAGAYINVHSESDERVFIDGVFSQSVGILWHAHRYGIEEITANITRFQELEDTLNFKWVVLYGPGIGTIQTKQEVWEYIQTNYTIRQVGLMIQNSQYAPVYLVLEKGGVVDLTSFVQNKIPVLATTYEITDGSIDFYTISDEVIS
ncbi:MAG: glycosyltransferase family 39 protein [Candidatus Woesearchaeota archaeon]|jgi:hypothetical protein